MAKEENTLDIKIVTRVTVEHLKKYLLDIYKQRGDVVCPCCRSNTWTFHPAPGSDLKANIVTLPMPLSPGLGMWAFPVSCSGCGYLMLLEADKITSDLIRTGDL